MSVVRSSEMVDAPPQEVWRIVADPRNLPRWNRHIQRVTGVSDNPLKKGSKYEAELRAVGLSSRVEATVVDIDPPRSAEVRLTGPLEAVVITRLKPVGAGRTLLEHEVEYRLKGGPLGEMLGRALSRLGAGSVLKRGTRAQKRQVEDG
ncbi:MAG: SRPBCC family protein [Actinomycetota bacterium]